MARHAGHILITVVLALAAMGLIMLVSTGAWSNDGRVDIYYSVKRQFVWLAASVAMCAIISRTPYQWWRRLAPWFYAGACVLLVACFIPLIGEERNGSSRWISGKNFDAPFIHLQPSEFAKSALSSRSRRGSCASVRRARDCCRGSLRRSPLRSFRSGLIAAEVDIGSAALLGLAAFSLMFAAGANLLATGATVLGGLGAIWAAVTFIPNRARRFTDFLDVLRNPLDHLQDTGMQQVRGMMAFASGGSWGVGLGNGQQKIQGLPYAHTDFIFPMIGEELGLWATLLVIFCYVMLLCAEC